jgi:UDPglucose--hexose-1-phosphate uridylyltransferase
MKSIGETERGIVQLVQAAIRQNLIKAEDRIYAVNRLCDRLRIEGFAFDSDSPCDSASRQESIPELLASLANDAVARGVLDDLTDLREILAADLMNVFLDKPSVIQKHFDHLYASDPGSATDWFYRMSQASNAIQTRQIARNIVYQAASPYGTLDITINLSKPEKNPRDIAAARLHHSTGYPRCLLCIENEGYAGRIGHPARANHRMIRLRLGGEAWYFQYSPYAYYPEHCIVLSHEHRDMHIDRSTLDNLLEFVTLFPHYFIGSNADLPIVGGSILTHDHYQGGRYELPMARAGAAFGFCLPSYPGLQASVLNWPMATMRLVGQDVRELAEAAESVLDAWRHYSDPANDIIARDDHGPHNTITPIARRRGQSYEMDLVLRNNGHDDNHPLGIFHPHADVHHIKKENIGLIEVMGLAVLPARLLTELDAVKRYLQNQPATVAPIHQPWAEQLRRQFHGPLTETKAQAVVRQGVAAKFEQVLADAGVFKPDKGGRTAFRRFLAATGAVFSLNDERYFGGKDDVRSTSG